VKKRYSTAETISVELGHTGGLGCEVRPFLYSPAEGDRLCRRIEHGESLRSLTSGRKSPSRPTLLRWLCELEAFRIAYMRGCDARRADIEREILTADERAAKSKALSHIRALCIEGAEQARLLAEAKRLMFERFGAAGGVSIR
jgi:hypothetical protein